MLIKTFIPSADNHLIDVPKEYYGKEIEVFFTEKTSTTLNEKEARLNEINKKYSKFPKTNRIIHPFNRVEANNFD
jgi:hypothetical protein